MDFDIFRPILSGLIGGLAVYLLARSGSKPAPRIGDRRSLSYGLGFKLFTAILIPGSAFVAYAAAHASSDQLLLAISIATIFVVAAIFFAYQAFFVSFAYDNENIYYRTPLAGAKVIPWSEVEDVAYSSLMQSHYLHTKQVRRIWCSNMLRGYDELGDFLSKKADELFSEDR